MRIMYIMSNIDCRGLALLACTFQASLAFAQSSISGYPAKPIKIIVPYIPGGGVDTAARVTGQKISEVTGQPVIVENKPGAGTNIGSDFVAKAPGDGYTMLLSNSSQVANATMYGKTMSYDLLRDLAPVTMIGMTPVLLVVHPSLPVKTARDLIALAKARPGQLTFASAGIGSPTHIAPELFRWMAKIDMLHVPYKGGSQAVTDLIGGQITCYFAAMSTGLPLAKSGRLRAVAVTSPRRFSAVIPEVPTVAESGLPGYELVGWFGLLIPSSTPAELVNRVYAVAVQALRASGMKERLLNEGTEVVANSPQEFDAFTRRELVKYEKLVKAANIKPE
ncbi:MAG: tripartite tricarboxylate transporter substrate binding protein [Betaproteobacteria bacterium]|nr:tripartite tricarboxylate transporter substrate binding protein [Betaproteobacteria bacterium]